MKLGDYVEVLPGSNHPQTLGCIGTIVQIGPYNSNLMDDDEICISFNPDLIYKMNEVRPYPQDEFYHAEQKWKKKFGL